MHNDGDGDNRDDDDSERAQEQDLDRVRRQAGQVSGEQVAQVKRVDRAFIGVTLDLVRLQVKGERLECAVTVERIVGNVHVGQGGEEPLAVVDPPVQVDGEKTVVVEGKVFQVEEMCECVE